MSIRFYDWRIHEPLREEETYALSGGITAFERTARDAAPVCDCFNYEIAIDDLAGARIAEVAFAWHFWRVAAPSPPA